MFSKTFRSIWYRKNLINFTISTRLTQFSTKLNKIENLSIETITNIFPKSSIKLVKKIYENIENNKHIYDFNEIKNCLKFLCRKNVSLATIFDNNFLFSLSESKF